MMLSMRLLTPASGRFLILLPMVMLFFSAFVNPTVFGFISKHYPSYLVGRLGGLASGLAIVGSVGGIGVGALTLHLTGYYYVPMRIMATVIFAAGLIICLLKVPGIYANELTDQSKAEISALGSD
jgi:MFS family permease